MLNYTATSESKYLVVNINKINNTDENPTTLTQLRFSQLIIAFAELQPSHSFKTYQICQYQAGHIVD